jgi:hypothetical protein
MEAVDFFARKEPLELVQKAANEISLLLTDEMFINSPESVLIDMGCYYDPRSEGMTVIGWLQQVQKKLRGVSVS